MNTSLKIMQTISEIGGLWPSNRPKLKALSMIVWPHLTLPAHSHHGHVHEQFFPLPRPLPHEWARWPYHSDLDLRNKQSKERQSRHKMIRRLTSIRQCKTCNRFPVKTSLSSNRQTIQKQTRCVTLQGCDPVWFCFGVIQYTLCDPEQLFWCELVWLFWCDPVYFVLGWPSTTVLVWAGMTVLVWPSILCFGVTSTLLWRDRVHFVLGWSSTVGVIHYILFWCDPLHFVLVWSSTFCFGVIQYT